MAFLNLFSISRTSLLIAVTAWIQSIFPQSHFGHTISSEPLQGTKEKSCQGYTGNEQSWLVYLKPPNEDINKTCLIDHPCGRLKPK